MGAVCGGKQRETTNYKQVNHGQNQPKTTETIPNTDQHHSRQSQTRSSQQSHGQIVSTNESNQSIQTHRSSINIGDIEQYSRSMELEQQPFLFGIDNEESNKIIVGKQGMDITYKSNKIGPLPIKYRLSTNNESNIISNHISDQSSSSIKDEIHIETTPKHQTNQYINFDQTAPIFSCIMQEIIAIYDQNRKQKDQIQPISVINKEIIKTLNRRFVHVLNVYILYHNMKIFMIHVTNNYKDNRLLLLVLSQNN